MKSEKVLVVPVFISHEGCPYRCVFCSQPDITGANRRADESRVRRILRDYLEPTDQLGRFARREIAFYGGSFTGLPDARQEFLLTLVRPWVDNARVHAVRVSTHPLMVNRSDLKRLKAHKVETVELGIQSTNPEVLELSGRPCSLDELRRTVSLIREFGLKLGLQLMLGLPGDSEERFFGSVSDVVALAPDFVRLYPTLVLRHTPLYEMYRQGRYAPWTLERTLDALKGALISFNRAGIPVVRVGLQPDPSLIENFVAGPFHPSLRYLADCRIGLERMITEIECLDQIPKRVLFKVPLKSVSIYTGNHRENITQLKERFGLDEVKLSGEVHCRQIELVA